ncbi:MAG: cobalamin B12-binding domain-containing protein [Hyphomicrobiales bacterium]|jgi:methanogenic corrinoid protein MtbC1
MAIVQNEGRPERRRAGSDGVPSDLSRSSGAEASSVNGLIHTIEGEIIPRLLLAHQSLLRDETGEAPSSGDIDWSNDNAGVGIDDPAMEFNPLRVTHADVTAFAELLISFAPSVAKRFIDAQIARGHAVPDLLLDLCAPTAKELGDMWLRDACSFCDVTIGLSALEQVVLHCSGPAGTMRNAPDQDRSALFAPMPGNQHIFGLLIVKELFRRSGWTVRSPSSVDRDAILDAVRKTRFSILGLSIGSSDDLQSCQSLVKACRDESLNPNLLILVGGYGIQEPNMSTRMLGVDLIARDGREGLDQIERMMSRIMPQRPYN